MGFGQYSSDYQPRRSKREMVETVTRIHGAPVAAALTARNTLDYTTQDGTRRVRYHDTDVVTQAPDGTVILNTGGYNTLTTRDRINSAKNLKVRVYSDKGTIHARPLNEGESYAWSGGVPFETIARISPDGKVTPDKSAAEIMGLHKLIDRYIKALKKEFPRRDENGEPDSGGDPWMIGGVIPSRDVALNWLGADLDSSGEPYIFNSIVAHALKASGMQDAGVGFYMHGLLTGKRKVDNYITGKVRRYFRKALGI